MPLIKALDKNTIRSIHSGQVITTIDAIVKELLENSLDANANTIDIKIIDDGLLKIEVLDNGYGIAMNDRCNMARQHYTSKLSTFNDLEKVTTYGFRGEALSALCEISGEVYITTKTKHDRVAICYKLDRHGGIQSETPSGSIPHTGTLVSVYQPFIHLPVRRQVAMKTRANSTKRIQELTTKYGLSHPFIRLCFHQLTNTMGKTKTPWIKPSTKNLLDGVRVIYDTTLASMVEESSLVEDLDQDHESVTPIRLHCLLPSTSSDPSHIFKGDRVFIYVDKRPINYAKSELKELVTMVRKRYKQTLGLEDDGKKIPFMYIDIKTGYGDYDVNIEPDKSVVMLHGKTRILDLMQRLLDQTYGSFFSSNKLSCPLNRHSPEYSQTIQQVPCQSPQPSTVDIPRQVDHTKSDPIQLDELADDDELEEDLFVNNQPRHNSPPLLTDWLHQQRLLTGNNDDQSPALDWQVDDESHIGDTSPTPPPTNQLTDWLAKFRRPTGNAKRQVNEDSYALSAPMQAKRPRVQIPLSFTHPMTPLALDDDFDSSLTRNSPQLSPTVPSLDTTRPTTIYHSTSPLQDTSDDPLASPTRTNTSSPAQSDTPNSRPRNMASLFNKMTATSSKALLYSANHKDITHSDLISTLDDVISINTSIGDIRKSYAAHRDRHSQLYRKSVADYCKQVSSYQTSPEQSSVILDKKLKDGIMVFTKGAYTGIGWVMTSIGVLDMTMLQKRYRFQQLMEDYTVNSGKYLTTPSQINIRHDMPVYGVIILLEKRDEYIANDGHKSTEHTYSLITDKRITANGFRARWRKDTYSHDLIVQFTAISDLNGYGPSDFYELLALIGQGETDMKRLRPKKVVDYFINKVNHLVATPVENTSWDDMLAALDQETQDRWEKGKSSVHYLL
ncbi:hypothetical protein BC941DRAFT_385530 [Chlamydoabsidia padenii]|nr:hypothetical protein BC941DRAFT_385530 [Chlamydoabsidia padenii]